MVRARRTLPHGWALRGYLVGQGISLLGDEAYYVALAWAAVRAGGAVGVTVVSVAAAIPRAVLMLVGGAVCDRFGLRRVMLTSDAVRMIVISAAAVLTIAGPRLDVLVVTAVIFGIADAMFMPAAAAMPPRLVTSDRMQHANALITFMQRAALLVGAPLGGLLAAGPGVAAAFGFDAATFAFSLVCLGILPLRPLTSARRPDGLRPAGFRGQISDGLRATWNSPVIRGLIFCLVITELAFTGPFNTGLTLLAHYRGWGAQGIGYMLAAFGLGAAAGALGAIAVRRRTRAGHLIIGAIAVQALMIGLLAMVHELPLALVVAAVAGVASSLAGTTIITLVQLRAEPAQLGRVMSVVSLSSYGTVPIANAMTGTIAAIASVPPAFLVGAALEGIAAIVGMASRAVRTATLPNGGTVKSDSQAGNNPDAGDKASGSRQSGAPGPGSRDRPVERR